MQSKTTATDPGGRRRRGVAHERAAAAARPGLPGRGVPPRRPMHNATVEIFEPGRRRLRLRAPRRADRRPDRVRARATASGCSRCPGGWPTRSGSTTTDFDLGYHVRRSALPRPGTMDQLRELVAPDHVAGRSTAAARCGRSTSSRGSPTAGSRCSPRATRSWSTASRPSTSARCCSTPVPGAARTLGDDDWQPRRPPSGAGLALSALADNVARPARRWCPHGRSNAEALGARGRRALGARVGAVANALAGRRPAAGLRRSPASSRSSAGSSRSAPTLADYRDDPRGARRHRQRRHPGHRHRRAARLADDPRRVVGGLRQIRAMVPMSVIDDELEATSLGSQITGHFVDLPIGEASPVVRLHQVSYAFQAHRRPAAAVAANRLAGHRRLRADDVPRARLAGRGGRAAPRLPLIDHQRARPAVPAVRRRRADGRDLPGPPLLPGPRAGDRRDVVRRRGLLRHHRRPRRGPGRRRPRPVPARGARRAARHAPATPGPRAPRGRKKAAQAKP